MTPRTDDQPYYSLLSKAGWRDIRWTVRHHGLDWLLVQDIINDTWFAIKWKAGKR